MLREYKLTAEEHFILFNEMSHPDVSPYVRNFVSDFTEYLKHVTYILEAQERGEMIVRVIVNEWNRPIGMISLYDITEYGGFLSTWLGKSYHGKGYNHIAKELFLNKLFNEYNIETIFMKIRVGNHRSERAALKLAYVSQADENYVEIYAFINANELKYNLFTVRKLDYLNYQMNRQVDYIPETETYSMLS